MRYSVSQAARLAGVSVRTLRWYDQIGLLKPTEVTPAGAGGATGADQAHPVRPGPRPD